MQKQLEDTRSINQRLFDEVREKNDKERERLRKLEESKAAISALRSENENIFTEHEKLKIQVSSFTALRLTIFMKEADASDMKLRLESEIDDMKVQLLKYESDLNQETDRRKIAENEAKAAKMVAENLLKESQKFITRGLS